MQRLTWLISILLLFPAFASAVPIEDEYLNFRMQGDWEHSVRLHEARTNHKLLSEALGTEVNFSADGAAKLHADNLELAATRVHEMGQKNWPTTFAREGRTLDSFSSTLVRDRGGWTSTFFGLDSTGETFRATTHLRVGQVLNIFVNSREQEQPQLKAITDEIIEGMRD